ncbi:MAG: N-acetylneuraminate synthase family protein [Longimicrobiales bacterium]
MSTLAIARAVTIGDRRVGDGHRAYPVAEIGINHNGDIGIAKRLIEDAARAGCDAVKLQKRTPALCVPADQRGRLRQTPWGDLSYLDYRRRVELGRAEYDEIDRFCRSLEIAWFASCWDEPSVDFIEAYDPPCYKIQSAAVTDFALLRRLRATGRPLILSTGMSNLEQIHAAVDFLDTPELVILHSTSAYPCQPTELNLRMIHTLRREFPGHPIGYSGHEVGLPTTVAAVAMGACYVERHITLDRAMWGSDQAASIEPQGFARLAHYVRSVESALGDGIKQVYASEIPVMQRRRRVK